MLPTVNNINCGNCKNNCCGAIPNLIPVLLPEEVDLFILKEKHENSFYDLWTLKRKENGSCAYFDDNSKRCGIYSSRPLECRIYPFLLDFTDDFIIKLDSRYCERASLAIKPRVNLTDIPEGWVKAYLEVKKI